MYIAYGFMNYHDALFWLGSRFLFLFLFCQLTPFLVMIPTTQSYSYDCHSFHFHVSTCFFILIGYRI